MSYELVKAPLSKIRKLTNIRGYHGTPEERKALAESLRVQQHKPISLRRSDMSIIDGNRRVEAAEEAGLTELWAIVTDEEITPERLVEIQLELDIHHKKLSLKEITFAVIAMKASNPGVSNRELAKRIGMDETLFCKHLKLQSLGPDGYEAYDQDRIPFTDAVIIAGHPIAEQARLVAMKLNGSNRSKLQEAARKPQAEKSRTRRLASKTANGTSVVITGPEMTLEQAREVLAEVSQQIGAAIKDRHDATTFKVWLNRNQPRKPRSQGGPTLDGPTAP